MSKKPNNKIHPSETDLFSYHDKSDDDDNMTLISEHIENCEDCRRILTEIEEFSGLLDATFKNMPGNTHRENCLTDIQLSEYIEGRLSVDKRNIVEEHLSNCNYCLDILTGTKDFLKEEIREEDIPSSAKEKTEAIIRKSLREKRFKNLMKTLATTINDAPDLLHDLLKETNQGMREIFQNTFTYPSPAFPPVFGETQNIVRSPFGKIRPPIFFEWASYTGATGYELSIEETNWVIITEKTKIEVSQDQAKLSYDREYLWKLKIFNDKKILDEINGFFTIPDKEELRQIEEIENQLIKIESETDRLILWGGMLETKELYIEAIRKYGQAYESEQSAGIAYRIAYCYDKLELDAQREYWNSKIPNET